MTAVYTVTLVCDGHKDQTCPVAARLVLETPSSGQARREASRLHGWSFRWTPGAHKNNRKIADVCDVCDPERRSTR